MDTVYTLVGKIGMENLSSNAQTRLAKLNELNDGVINLQKALDESEKKDQAVWEKKLNEAQKVLDNHEADFQVFLDLEWKDLEKRKKAKEEANEKAKADAEAKAKADAEAKAKADALAQQQAQSQPPTTEKKGGSTITTVIVGGVIAIATFGAINYFKNK